MTKKIYQRIAELLAARDNCRRSGNGEWEHRHDEELTRIIKDFMPSGSGWDRGTTLEDNENPEKLVFTGSFHHMDDGGGYDGWTDHTITVTPSMLFGIHIKVSGRNRNDIKNYLAEIFDLALNAEVAP